MFIDLLCLILVGIGFYIGYSKGIIKSIFGIISILVAFLVSLKFSFLMIRLIEKLLNADPRLNIILGFVLTFFLVMVVIRLTGKAFEKILETAHINFINKLAGGIISGLVVLMMFSYIILFIDRIKLLKASAKSDSLTYSYLETVPSKSGWLIKKTKIIFSEFWDKTQEALDKVEKEFPNKEGNEDRIN